MLLIRLNLLTLLLTLQSVWAEPAIELTTELPDFSKNYDYHRDIFTDSQAALDLAKKHNKRLIIDIGGNWCSWCMALKRTIENDVEINRQLHNNFIVLKVNVSKENNNQNFISGLPKFNGYPQIFISSAEGEILHSQDTNQFLNSNKKYAKEKILAFIEHWKSPQNKSNSKSKNLL